MFFIFAILMLSVFGFTVFFVMNEASDKQDYKQKETCSEVIFLPEQNPFDLANIEVFFKPGVSKATIRQWFDVELEKYTLIPHDDHYSAMIPNILLSKIPELLIIDGIDNIKDINTSHYYFKS